MLKTPSFPTSVSSQRIGSQMTPEDQNEIKKSAGLKAVWGLMAGYPVLDSKDFSKFTQRQLELT